MTPEDVITGLQVICVLQTVLAILLWAIPSACRCDRCAYHRHEAAEKKRAQREMAHDSEHKGWGWQKGAPDRYGCSDENCSRNPRQD